MSTENFRYLFEDIISDRKFDGSGNTSSLLNIYHYLLQVNAFNNNYNNNIIIILVLMV